MTECIDCGNELRGRDHDYSGKRCSHCRRAFEKDLQRSAERKRSMRHKLRIEREPNDSDR